MMKANEYNEDKNTNEDKILYLLKYLIGKKEVGRKWLNFRPLTKIFAD